MPIDPRLSKEFPGVAPAPPVDPFDAAVRKSTLRRRNTKVISAVLVAAALVATVWTVPAAVIRRQAPPGQILESYEAFIASPVLADMSGWEAQYRGSTGDVLKGTFVTWSPDRTRCFGFDFAVGGRWIRDGTGDIEVAALEELPEAACR